MQTPQKDHGRQDHGEHERQPGLGGRVRRFVESELGRVLDKSDRRVGRDEVHPVPTAAPDAVSDPAPEPQARHEEARGEPATAVVAEHSTGPVNLLNNAAGLREQWYEIQGRFVDDPQRAVHEAGRLVERTLDEIRASIESTQPSDTMSTDELRVSFRHYREFFERLLSA